MYCSVYCISLTVTTHLIGQPELPTAFWLISTVPPKREIWMLQFCNQNIQIAVSSTRQNRSINPPYFRLTVLACMKCSVLYLHQSQWVFLCTHEVWRWHFHFKTNSGRHKMCQLRFLSGLSSAKNASWMINLWSEAT